MCCGEEEPGEDESPECNGHSLMQRTSPFDPYNYVYLFNSFRRPVMRRVMDTIQQSWRDDPGR